MMDNDEGVEQEMTSLTVNNWCVITISISLSTDSLPNLLLTRLFIAHHARYVIHEGQSQAQEVAHWCHRSSALQRLAFPGRVNAC